MPKPQSISHSRLLSLLMLWSLIAAQIILAATSAPVAVVTPTYQEVYREIRISGTVTSPRVSQLSVMIAGQVQTLSVDEGDLVRQGQELLQLDDELAGYDLAQVKARVRQEETRLRDARRRLEEAEALGPRGSIAATQIEDLRAEVALEESALIQAEAEAGYQQALLNRHELRAPFDGMISQRQVDLGEWVTPGQGIFELVAMDDLRLDFELSEDYLGQVSTGSDVSFTVNALPGQSFQGKVQAVVPVTDPGARTFLVRVIPENPLPQLVPGMSVSALLRIATNQKALVVPRDAILRSQDGRIVAWVVKTGSDNQLVAEERVVTLDQAFSGLVVVLSGIEPDDQVVVEGNESLQNGSAVTIVPSSKGG